MSTKTAVAGQRSISLVATVLRCGCSEAQKASVEYHGLSGLPCPRPRQVERLGKIAYWNRNPVLMLAWKIGRWMRGKAPGIITSTTKDARK